MVTVKPDAPRNLLVLKFSGQVASEEVKQHMPDVVRALAALKPGFCLLTDLSELESMEYAAAPYISHTMDQCNGKGVVRVVRVIPDNRKDIGFKMLSYFHYGHQVGIITCETLQEAHATLVN